MSTIKGENLMIFVKEGDLKGTTSTRLVPLALATNCTLSIDVEAFDVTSKDSGSWKESVPGMKGWSMTTDNLYSPDADLLMTAAIGRSNLTLYWCAATNVEANNAVTHTAAVTVGSDTYKYYTGTAWISQINANAANNEAANFTVSFTGTGALSQETTLPTQAAATN